MSTPHYTTGAEDSSIRAAEELGRTLGGAVEQRVNELVGIIDRLDDELLKAASEIDSLKE